MVNDIESRVAYLKEQINKELEIFKRTKNSSLYRLFYSSLELMDLEDQIDDPIIESAQELGKFALSKT